MEAESTHSAEEVYNFELSQQRIMRACAQDALDSDVERVQSRVIEPDEDERAMNVCAPHLCCVRTGSVQSPRMCFTSPLSYHLDIVTSLMGLSGTHRPHQILVRSL